MKQKSNTGFFSVFLAVGLLILFIAILVVCWGIRFRNNSAPVQAKIVNIETHYNSNNERNHRVYVSYEVDGVLYSNVRIGSYSSFWKEGDTIEVHYSLSDPGRAQSMTVFYILSPVLFFMGIIFGGVGLFGVLKGQKNQRLLKKLRHSGTKTVGVIADIRVDGSMSVNGRHPYSVILIRFYADRERIEGSGGCYKGFSLPIGKGVAVYYDPSDPKTFACDFDDATDDLPENLFAKAVTEEGSASGKAAVDMNR